MKIGLISINMYSKGLNFACPLHTYAFQQFLLKNGVKSVVVDYKPNYYDNFNLRHPYDYYKHKLDICAKKQKQSLTSEERQNLERKINHFQEKANACEPLYHEREIRYDKFQNFIDQNYIKTDICYDSDLLEIMDPKCDCYICVTDVIWKNQPNCGFDRGFFLGSTVMENKVKLSYAASRGVYYAENKEEEDLFFHYLQDFDAISVREASLKDYIEKNSELSAMVVLDPVLLHEKEFYDNIIEKPQEENYLLLYYVMEKATDTIKYAVEYAKKHNLKIVELSDMPEKGGRLNKYKDIEHVYRYDVGVEEWLGYFKYAECVFTNSFHASCFCILFQKDFYVGFRYGDKVSNVMETFGLKKRMLPENKDIIKSPLPPIDYEKVEVILKQKRAESSEFILSAIRENKRTKKEKDYSIYKRRIQYPISFNSKLKHMPFTWDFDEAKGNVATLASGSIEYSLNEPIVNDGSYKVPSNGFYLENYLFRGWHIRFRIDNRWFWYLKNGTIIEKKKYKRKKNGALYLLKDGDTIPYIPVNHISKMVAEAVWKKITADGEEDLPDENSIDKGNQTESIVKKAVRRIWKMIKPE